MAGGSFLLAFMRALANNQVSESQMQITDSKSAMLGANMESNMYKFANKPQVGGGDPKSEYPHAPAKPPASGPLAYQNWWIQHEAYLSGILDSSGKPKYPDASSNVTAHQEQYSSDSSKYGGAQSQMDGAVQSAQGQTSSDATNLQMMVQSANSLMSIIQALTGLIGRGITA